MKAIQSLYIDVEVTERVKVLAREVNASIGDLMALFLNYGMDRVSVDALKAWAAKQPERRGRPSGGLKATERACLSALDSLYVAEARYAEGKGTFRFSPEDVAHKAGLRVAIAHDSLNALRLRGLVDSMEMDPGEVDRFGRAKTSAWWKPEHERDRQARALAAAKG